MTAQARPAVTKSTGLLAVVAHCENCDKTWEERNATGTASYHAKRTGHHVWIEQTTVIIWNRP